MSRLNCESVYLIKFFGLDNFVQAKPAHRKPQTITKIAKTTSHANPISILKNLIKILEKQ